MAEDIKDLIEKIQQEGIQVAEDKARDMQDQASRRAEAIVAEAQKKAQQLIDSAKEEIAQMEKSGQASLEQTARDLLLSLKEEINLMLEKIVVSQLRQALSPDEMGKIITALIKEMSSAEEGETIVSLKEKDLEKVEKGILHKLGEEAKKGITLKPSGEITGGFIISYDSGKSHFDFTDRAIAEYLGLHLKPKLAALLKDASSGKKRHKES